MSLKQYRHKRDFQKTPEPSGAGAEDFAGRNFVIQKHAATRLHYDFRLELDGVLKSWAVPKGPSLDPAVKALAVQVEDHPLDYADFEGTIPKGQYGGGTVMVWDQGAWQPEGNAAKGLRDGKLNFELFGEKLHGQWSLVRMGGRAGDDGKNWLLLKRQDDAARKLADYDVQAEADRSIVTGRSLDEIAAGKRARPASDTSPTRKRGDLSSARRSARLRVGLVSRGLQKVPASDSDIASLPKARRAPMPEKLSPQLATLVRTIPTGDDWLHEVKFDGYRILAWIENGRVRLRTRKGNDWTDRFPRVAEAVAAVPLNQAILDGEIVALDQQGRTVFQRLQNSLNAGRDASLIYYVFDIPYAEGFNLTQTPLEQRKQLLEQILLGKRRKNVGVVRYSDFVRGRGEEVFEHACRSGTEGILSKQANSTYETRRTSTWVKTKCLQRQEFVIGGYSPPEKSRTGFGALLIGYFDHDKLIYCGRVGTGFTDRSLREIRAALGERHVSRSPFANPPAESRDRHVTWVKPDLVAEVAFTQWTEDGVLRHPSFQGLREDKPAKEIGREQPTSLASQERKRPESSTGAKRSRHESNGASTIAGVTLSHPERVVYPEQGLTKLDLARYYESVAEWILPHVVGRPLTLVRCPQGRQKHCFFQKHLTEAMHDHIGGVMIEESEGRQKYVAIDDLSGLIALVQMGVMEIHPWGARSDNVELPDRLVFDLDPGEGVAWEAVIEAARLARDTLERISLQSFVRTTGGKGLHVVVPLTRRADWDAAKGFAQSLAAALVSAEPERLVMNMSKARRRGKIFVDFFRNQRGATSVASYSTRARAGAPVATPLRWNELSPKLTPDAFTVMTLPKRLASLKADPWEGFFSVRQSLTAKVLRAAAQNASAKRR